MWDSDIRTCWWRPFSLHNFLGDSLLNWTSAPWKDSPTDMNKVGRDEHNKKYISEITFWYFTFIKFSIIFLSFLDKSCFACSWVLRSDDMRILLGLLPGTCRKTKQFEHCNHIIKINTGKDRKGFLCSSYNMIHYLLQYLVRVLKHTVEVFLRTVTQVDRHYTVQ